jgi:hypothetical protein
VKNKDGLNWVSKESGRTDDVVWQHGFVRKSPKHFVLKHRKEYSCMQNITEW